jgi:hypothetical protein
MILRDSIWCSSACTKPQSSPNVAGLKRWQTSRFQSIGAVVGQNISGALAGKMSVDEALKDSQAATQRTVKQAGYLK